MRIHLRSDSPPGDSHQHFTVFVNGANAGKLCVLPQEAANFHQIVAMGCSSSVDEFVSTGEWIDPPGIER